MLDRINSDFLNLVKREDKQWESLPEGDVGETPAWSKLELMIINDGLVLWVNTDEKEEKIEAVREVDYQREKGEIYCWACKFYSPHSTTPSRDPGEDERLDHTPNTGSTYLIWTGIPLEQVRFISHESHTITQISVFSQMQPNLRQWIDIFY